MSNEFEYEPYNYGSSNKQSEPKVEEVEIDQEDQGIDQEINQEVVQEVLEEEKAEDTTYSYKYSNYYEYTDEKPRYEEPVQKPRKEKRGFKRFISTVALAVVFGLVASAVFLGSVKFFGNKLGIGISEKYDEVGTTQISTSSGTIVHSDVADVVDEVMPSVVSITNMSIQEVQNFFYGTQQYQSESRGSGIIIGQNDKELLIVTNYHVVEGSTSLTVSFIDEENVEAQIKGTESDRDLAIIAVPLSMIKAETMNSIKVATLGDSDALRVGETTIAIGNALGYGQSVTTGIVSALDRQLDNYEGELIQTDAAINEGNSGGALLNANGEVIGINSAKLYGDKVESMGYAIPISDVTDILNELMNRETKVKVAEEKRGSLGIRGTTVDANYSQVYNMPEGVFVSEIIEGGAAEKAGLQPNCIITKLNGTSIDTMDDLIGELEYYEVGETVTLTIQVPERGGYAEEKIDITLYKMQAE